MKHLMRYPTSSSISYWWNLGSLLGIFLSVQIVTGFLMTLIYENSVEGAFCSIQEGVVNYSWGFLVQALHANGANFFFFFLYLHLFRGIIFQSYQMKSVWVWGWFLMILSMLVAFMGYFLPFGNMSLWAGTVITNLLSVLPFVGEDVVLWFWGSYFVSNSLLKLFFSLHFLLPFLMLVMVFQHVFELHKSGSSGATGVKTFGENKLPFYSFGVKDVMNLFVVFLFFLFVLLFPYLLMDSDMFVQANRLSSPKHIQPEWYFLFAYAILRGYSTKLGGVLALCMSVLVILFLIFAKKEDQARFHFIKVFVVFFCWCVLTFLGSKGVEYPYLEFTQVFTTYYFYSFIFIIFL